jgi:hypothetical protein
VNADEKGLYILHSEVEEAIKEMKDKKVQEVIMYLEMYAEFWEKMISK